MALIEIDGLPIKNGDFPLLGGELPTARKWVSSPQL